MTFQDRRIVPVTALALAFLLADVACAVAPVIKDDGKFFSPEAVKKANEVIREIAKKYQKDLLIETFEKVPDAQAERVKAMSREERNKFFQNWAEDREDIAVVNGIYILVCKQPPQLNIVVTAKTRSSFDQQAYEKLREILIKKFAEKKYDDGLQAAVEFVRSKFEAAGSK